MRCLLPVLTGLMLATGCQSTTPTVHPETVSGQDAALLGHISKLVGDWESTDDTGNKHHASNFAVTSGGSAVREIMWPGMDHEMTNLYHMDGGVLVCTHYCAAGNQPRMVATHSAKTDEGTVFLFEFDSVSNLRESHEHYMGNLTLTILEDGRLREDWRSYDRGGNLTDPTTFLLTRKGS